MEGTRPLQVGDRITWHVRPEVHIDHGGYLTSLPTMGTVRSVHRGFVMVGTGKFSPVWWDCDSKGVEHILAVEIDNPSIKQLL